MSTQYATVGLMVFFGKGIRCRSILIHSQSVSGLAVRVDIPADGLYICMAGGMIQTLAGLTEFIRNNMFAGTALASYGAFWIGYGPYSVYIPAAALFLSCQSIELSF